MSEFAIGSELWPGVSKVVEEIGELGQVLGKLIGAEGEELHWDGTNLLVRLEEELADVQAALIFLQQANPRLNRQAIEERAEAKVLQFWQWHLGSSGASFQEPLAFLNILTYSRPCGHRGQRRSSK